MKLALLALGAGALFFIWRARGLHGGLKVLCSVALAVGISVLWPPETFEDRVARLAAAPDPPHAQTGCSASRRAIEARLKSPASAKWGDCLSTTSDGVQTVRLVVDSQNAFGAMLRSLWVTTVRNNNVETVVQLQ